MTNLLLRLFIRNYDRENPAASHSAIGKLSGIVGVVCNLLLFLGKLIMGLLAGSVSIVADAVNNLSDAASSVITFWGFRMAQRPADKNHPYGHARYEYLSGFVVATLILFIGFELAKSSVSRIISPNPPVFSIFTILVMVFSILAKLWMAAFFRSLGRRIQSTTLQATSADCRNDVIATSAVLLGCLIHHFFGFNLDGWIGLMVALFILYSGIGIARETISPLLGKRVDQDLLDHIEELILRHEGILGIHDLLVHDYGPGQYFASVHVELSADEDPQICHDIIDDIECDALRELNVNLVIHYDPVPTSDEELNEMRTVMEEIIQGIDPDLSMHDLRMVRGSKRTKLVFDLVVPYSMGGQHAQLKQQIDDELLHRGKAYRTVIRFDANA
ncbi:MAG: cation transporter [Clostridia bacterium]|nr:cation transporter [Clostridia bacterium]